MKLSIRIRMVGIKIKLSLRIRINIKLSIRIRIQMLWICNTAHKASFCLPVSRIAEDDEGVEPVLMKDTPLRQLLDGKPGGGGGRKGAASTSSSQRLPYAQLLSIGKLLRDS